MGMSSQWRLPLLIGPVHLGPSIQQLVDDLQMPRRGFERQLEVNRTATSGK
jgi:hypothetical protein